MAVPRSYQGDEKLIKLLERCAKPTCTPIIDGTVESFLRRIEVVHDEQGLGTPFFEGHRGHSAAFATFLVSLDEAGVRRHFDVTTEEGHRLL